jgi:DNA processing protein
MNHYTRDELLKVQLLCFDNPKRANRIINTFSTYSSFESNISGFISNTIKQNQHQSHFKNRLDRLQTLFNKIKAESHKFISINDSQYPSLLKETATPPVALFYAGNISLASTPQIAVVGSRKSTNYASRVIDRIVTPLLPFFSITSGLAEGVDTLAHTAALGNGGSTIAVIGNGIDIIYPIKNKTLYEKIINQGLILSEFPPGTYGKPHHFPQRNRIVSGLAKSTLVIEASRKSGALITAYHALDQNRDVFAIPGPIDSSSSEGCHILIQEGGKLIQSHTDILNEYQIKTPPTKKMAVTPNLPQQETIVIKHLSQSPASIDHLLKQTQLPIQSLLQSLTILEVNGFAKRHPGQQFSLL